MVNGSPILTWAFVALAMMVAGAFVAALRVSRLRGTRSFTRRDTMLVAIATAAWLAATLALAASGCL